MFYTLLFAKKKERRAKRLTDRFFISVVFFQSEGQNSEELAPVRPRNFSYSHVLIFTRICSEGLALWRPAVIKESSLATVAG